MTELPIIYLYIEVFFLPEKPISAIHCFQITIKPSPDCKLFTDPSQKTSADFFKDVCGITHKVEEHCERMFTAENHHHASTECVPSYMKQLLLERIRNNLLN